MARGKSGQSEQKLLLAYTDGFPGRVYKICFDIFFNQEAII